MFRNGYFYAKKDGGSGRGFVKKYDISEPLKIRIGLIRGSVPLEILEMKRD